MISLLTNSESHKMTTRERLMYYLKHINCKKQQFYRKTGLSNGLLDKSSDFNTQTIRKIIEAFPDLNLTWLVTGDLPALNYTVADFLGVDMDSYVPGLPVNELTITQLENGQYVISKCDYETLDIKLSDVHRHTGNCYERYNITNKRRLNRAIKSLLVELDDD